MKAAFFHDTPLYTDGKDYYSISFTYGMWKSRYLKVFDELIVCTRVRNIADLSENVRKGYTISNGQGVVMAPVSAYKTLPDMFLKREKIRAQIKETLKNVDAAIIRLPSIIGLMACECCIEENVPWGVEVVTCVLDAYRGQGIKGRIVAPYLYRQNRKYIKMAGAAVYVTNNFLQQRYPTEAPSESISNVALDEPSGDVLERRLQKIEKMSEPVVFGLVGSLDVNFKGHDVAIRALAGIKNDIPISDCSAWALAIRRDGKSSPVNMGSVKRLSSAERCRQEIPCSTGWTQSTCCWCPAYRKGCRVR